MAQVRIADEASLETWLKGRPKKDAEVIALRADLRAFPFWVQHEGEHKLSGDTRSTMPFLNVCIEQMLAQRTPQEIDRARFYPKLDQGSPAFAPFKSASSIAGEHATLAAAKAAETAIEPY